jgi:hypothetical protein
MRKSIHKSELTKSGFGEEMFESILDGKISENLESLYLYMNSRLTQANLNNSIEMLEEVADLLLDIKSGWDAIPQDVIDNHAKSNAGIQPKSLASAKI